MNPGRKSNGMQKLYTKILHKIEDFPAKVLHDKVQKVTCNVEEFSVLSSKSDSSSSELLEKISKMEENGENRLDEEKPKDLPPERPLRRSKLNRKYENVVIANNQLNIVEPAVRANPRTKNPPDSDHDDDINMLAATASTLSLEDEIFQELEKAAIDEEKLNAALKNFDKILSDFAAASGNDVQEKAKNSIKEKCNKAGERKAAQIEQHKKAVLTPSISAPPAIALNVDSSNKSSLKSKSKIPLPQQVLMKSKTCSIIESRCILKKSRSTEVASQSVDNLLNDGKGLYRHFGEILLTKSLWSLEDLNKFAKSGSSNSEVVKQTGQSGQKMNMENNEKKMRDNCDGKNNYKTYKISSAREARKKELLTVENNFKMELKKDLSNLENSKRELKKELSSVEISKKKLKPQLSGTFIPLKIEKQKLVRTKSQLPRAKSVWELSSASPNVPRTTSGSRIPVKRAQTDSFSRAASTINLTTARSQLSQSPPATQKRTLCCDNVANINGSDHCKKLSASLTTLNSHNNGGMLMTVNKPAAVNSCNKLAIGKLSYINGQPHSHIKNGEKRQLNGSVSVSDLNKCIEMSPARREPRSDGTKMLVDGCNSNDQRHLIAYGRRESDTLSGKCSLEKGQMLAKKVEAITAISKGVIVENNNKQMRKITNSTTGSKQSKNTNKLRDLYLPQEAILNSRNEVTKVSGNNGHRGTTMPEHNNGSSNKIVSSAISKDRKPTEKPRSLKKTDKDEVDNCFKTVEKSVIKIEPVSVNFAKTKCVSNPKLESCKVIAASPFSAAKHKDGVKLVPVKEIINSSFTVMIEEQISSKKIAEKEYLSDYSDDSGHISNENEEVSQMAVTGGSGPGKISEELLKKFETTSQETKTVHCQVSCEPPSAKQLATSDLPISKMFTFAPKSEVFFRCGVLGQLEVKRDELLSDRIIQLQALSRGFLARRRLSQKRVQELAVRCIQRNVKAFLAVRDWPWWRLLVRVTPLLNVHRTEEQLKAANEELLTMRAKLEKFELDRTTLKCENEKLESKLSEMTCDLHEERSTANMTTERLEAEVSERLKLEKELEDQQKKVKDLQETTDKLEMELICAKSDLNGVSEDEDGENENGETAGGVYKLKYERVARELEFTKRRLQTQHEHDLEQLVGLKKQLEKKLADAYEEVEEQRQVVSQWKRKTQKMTNEMNDLRMMLEEQNGRNNVLEKKQRKFDAECQSLKDGTRQEKMAKERLAQEKEILVAEKFTLEQNLADTRMELELREEKLSTMQRELEELSFAGGTEEEVAQLKRSKLDFERKNKEQEEELDELAGQIQMLEQSKLRLEMTLETMRKDARREAQQRDDELEEVRGSSYKKIKALECQLEGEHEERTLLVREKHELERRLANLEEQDRADRANEEAINQKLRRDLRKFKALLKDAQTQLERMKADSPNKAVIRQIKNQLEDAETARSIAMKARQTAESELGTVQQMLEDSQRGRSEAEEKAIKVARERIELQAQIEENEEEIAELMKKFTATVKQLNQEQSNNSEYEIKISELELERNSLKEQIAELSARIENVENMNDPAVSLTSKRLELRIKELESRLELELATKSRIEIQCNRNKETIEKLQQEIHSIQHKELHSQEALKKSQKSLRELRDEFHVVSNREQENMTRRKDLEKRLETAESEALSLKNDLRLALQRVADLQQAMEEGDSDHTDSDINDSTDNSLSDFDLRPSPIKSRLANMKKELNGLDSNLVIKDGKTEPRPRAKKMSNASMASSSSEGANNRGDSSFA